jgi:hypothetical protein
MKTTELRQPHRVGLFGCRRVKAALALAAVGGGLWAGSPACFAQGANPTFAIPWFTIDCGGGSSTSADGRFSIQGTSGQPDAAVSRDTHWEVFGGFWHTEPSPCEAFTNTISLVQDNGTNSVILQWEPIRIGVVQYVEELHDGPLNWSNLVTTAPPVKLPVLPDKSRFFRISCP